MGGNSPGIFQCQMCIAFAGAGWGQELIAEQCSWIEFLG